MRCLWDTNVISEFLRGKNLVLGQKASAYLNRYRRSTFSILTRYEILRGLKVKNAKAQLARFENLCRKNEILPITDDIVVKAADLWAYLRRKGRLIEEMDLFIAATALHHGLSLATGNVGHFSRIPGLTIEDWTKS